MELAQNDRNAQKLNKEEPNTSTKTKKNKVKENKQKFTHFQMSSFY